MLRDELSEESDAGNDNSNRINQEDSSPSLQVLCQTQDGENDIIAKVMRETDAAIKKGGDISGTMKLKKECVHIVTRFVCVCVCVIFIVYVHVL